MYPKKGVEKYCKKESNNTVTLRILVHEADVRKKRLNKRKKKV